MIRNLKFIFFTLEPRQPIINDTNLIGKIEMKLPNPLILYCNSWGVPKPQITWLKVTCNLELK